MNRSEQLNKIITGLFGENYNEKLEDFKKIEPEFSNEDIIKTVNYAVEHFPDKLGVCARAMKILLEGLEK